MTDSFANLRSQLNLLAETFDRLGASLAENARGLREEMIPPDETLAEKISRTRHEFVLFREAVLDSAKATIALELQLNGQATSLRGLQNLIEQIEKHCFEMNELRRRATDLLDAVLSLRYRGHGSLPELRDCQQRAQAVRDHLTESFSAELLPDLKTIANRETAFADLLDLVNPNEPMDSEKATTLSIRLEESFGRRLVVEALRGQIYLPDKSDPTAQNPPELPCNPVASEIPSAVSELLPPFEQSSTPTVVSEFAAPDLTAMAEVLQTPIVEVSPEIVIGDAIQPEPVQGPTVTDELTTIITGQIVDDEEYLPATVEEAAITENLSYTYAMTEETPSTSRLDQNDTFIESPLTDLYKTMIEELLPQQYDVLIDEPQPQPGDTVKDETGPERFETMIGEPDPVQGESARGSYHEDEIRTAPQEIPTELASDPATLTPTSASDLMNDSIKTEVLRVTDPAFPEFSSSETNTEIIDAELVQAETIVHATVRVTGELTMKEPVPLGTTARDIALSLLKPDIVPEPETFSALLWQMVVENQLGLAFHLSQALEQTYPEMPNRLPSHLIRALALSRAVRYDSGEIASALQTDFARYNENFFATIEKDPDLNWSYAIQLLIASIVLRPALLAPSTQAESVISQIQLNTGLENLAGYCRAIYDFAIYKQPFDYLSLGPTRLTEQWQMEIEGLNQQVRDWYSRASRFDMEDGVAQKIWINWLMNQGKISSLLEPILQNDISQLTLVKSEIEALSNDLEIELEVNKTNREIRGWDAPEISSRALELICQYTREAISFAQKWEAMQHSFIRQQREDPINRNQDLRETLIEMRDSVFEDIEQFRRHQHNHYLNCAAQFCLRTVNEIDRLLSGVEDHGAESSIREIINADLLRIPEIPMNRRWEPEGVSNEQIIRGVIETVADTRSDWRRAFDLRKHREDHEATQRIIELLTLNRNTSVKVDELTAERNQHLQQCRFTLRSSIDTLREKIEAGAITEWLDEDLRADYIARIEDIERLAPSCLRFFELNERLKNLNLSLESYCVRMRVETEIRHNRESETLRNKIESVRLNLKDTDYKRIIETLEDGDTELTDEYLRITLRGDDLPIKYDEAYHLRSFFPQALRNIIAISNSILTGGSLVDDAKNLLGQDVVVEKVYRTIRAWESCKQTGHVGEEGLREILGFLGFNLHSAEPYLTRIPGDMVVTVSLKNENARLPLPQYGSAASGRYRILCLFEQQSPEEMSAFISSTSDDTPAIIFYFGCLLEEQRRKLARLCNENRLVFLVLDDLLILNLCKQPQPRTEAFFHCTAPFSFCNPYNPDRPAAPELFFGRSQELHRLLEMNGSSFVYSGRRYGKTSLLLEAKKQFEIRSPLGESDQLTIYLDLNTENIGTLRPPDYLWKRLSDLLVEVVGTTDNLRQNLGVGLTLSQIRRWLDSNLNRKIMLLLDEADTFLRLDGSEGYPRCNRLKSLIDEPTYRQRVKVVFAGGSHVLRSAQIEDQPLAHPDAAISIGPLLQNKDEIRAAIQLIEKVFTSIGYEFERPELILRILSQSDYYPNLIQLFCQHLINVVTGLPVPAFDMEQSPPYVLTSKHLYDAYNSFELKKHIRKGLIETLELDKRYLIIAQLMAYYSNNMGNVGFDASWIRYKALMWWPEGFRNCHSIFEILEVLEEMEQLHLLRKGDDRYYLRNLHLQSLFGTQEELEIMLSNSDKLIPSPQSEAASSHPPHGSQGIRRSPLTMRQFHQLRKRENGVSIIFGCRATDLDSADLFLAHSLPQEFVCINKYASRSDFVRTLSELQQRQHGIVQILYIPADCSWNEEWMAEATRYTETLIGRDRYTRVIFAADSVKTWRWLSLEEGRKAELNIVKVKPLFSLTPWEDNCLRLWLDDIGIRANDAERAQITQVTGNWPIMLEKFHKLASSDPGNWQQALNALNESFREYREELELSMGLHLTDPNTLLHELAKWGRASVDDLSAATGSQPEVVERTINWADLLGLVTPTVSKESEKVLWQLVPLVHRLLNL